MVFKAFLHMCRFGMVATDEAGVDLVKKPTTMMTNSVELFRELSRQCDGSHRHVQLMGGKAKQAAIYPEMRCRAVCKATARQMQADVCDLIFLECEISELLTIDDVQVDDVQQNGENHNWLSRWDDTTARSSEKTLSRSPAEKI